MRIVLVVALLAMGYLSLDWSATQVSGAGSDLLASECEPGEHDDCSSDPDAEDEDEEEDESSEEESSDEERAVA